MAVLGLRQLSLKKPFGVFIVYGDGESAGAFSQRMTAMNPRQPSYFSS